METLLFIGIFGCVYSYLIYPLILLVLTRAGWVVASQKSSATERVPDSVTVIVTVRNEAAVIRDKLQNTLNLQLRGVPLIEAGSQIIVASDASDDGTDEIVLEFAPQGVQLVRLAERGGKERAQQEALSLARGDIVVFTDAKIQLEPNAVENFLKYFIDPSVGAVSSIDRVEDSADGSSGEGFYVRYEMWLRSLESQFHSLVGLSGSCFAVRRDICEDLRVDIPSDFALLLAARRRNYRGVHGADVIARYKAVASAGAEFQRKVRTVLRGISTCLSVPEVLDPRRYGVFSWLVISHKLMRWFVPFFMILTAWATLSLAKHSLFYALFALVIGIFLFYATLGAISPQYRAKPLCKVPLFFLVSNAAIALAWVKYFSGERSVTWDPSKKAR